MRFVQLVLRRYGWRYDAHYQSVEYRFSDLDKTTMANIEAGSARLYAHAVVVWAVTLFALRLLHRFNQEAVGWDGAPDAHWNTWQQQALGLRLTSCQAATHASCYAFQHELRAPTTLRLCTCAGCESTTCSTAHLALSRIPCS